MEKLEYEIIESGSRGNAVFVEDMLFDVGVGFGKLKERLYSTKYIFITHIHSDHLRLSTARKIQKQFPRIQWIGNWEVAEEIPLDYMVGDATKIQLKDREIESFPCVHDVVTHGFVVKFDGLSMIYATDTAGLEYAPKGPFDYLFIESNHCEEKVERVRGQARSLYDYDAYAGAKRHLSTQKSKAFYYMYRKGPESEWIELHKSKRFY